MGLPVTGLVEFRRGSTKTPWLGPAYFDHHASNGPTEAINGRLEALRRNALGFRNLTHYRIRSLLHCGNLGGQINAL